MKIKNPFGMIGVVEIDAHYRVKRRMYKFDLNSKGATNKEKFDWDSFDTVELFVAVEYELFVRPGFWDGPGPPGKGEGKFGLSADWEASFSDKGVNLSLHGVQPRDWGPQSGGNEDVVVAVSARLGQSKLGDKTSFVEMVVDIVAGFAKDGASLGLRAGPFSGGISLSGKKGAGKDQLGLKLILDMEQPPPAPEKKPFPKISRAMTKTKVYFEKINEDKVPSASLRDLDKWTNDIEGIEELHDVIKAGRVEIYLAGHTSKSGTKLYNAKLANRRIESVERALNQRFGSTKVRYKKDPKDPSDYEEQNDYRVDVFFKKEEAEKAINWLRAGWR